MSMDSRDSRESDVGGSRTESASDKGSERLGPPEFLGYRIIREREEQDESPTSRSKFWKLCCIADRYLVEELNHDIGFPRHWYKYGEVGEPHSVNRGFLNAPRARFWEGQELFSDRKIPITEFDISGEDQRLIRRAASKIVGEFGKRPTKELKKHQYNNDAPEPFIEAYSKLRAQFEAVDLDQQKLLPDYSQGPSSTIENLLDEMLVTYPCDRYEDVYGMYLNWDDTMRLMYETGGTAPEMKSFLEFFVEKISEITLRFEHNRNIPEDRLDSWREEREEKIRVLDTGIEETRRALLEGYEPPEVLESVSDSFDRSMTEELDELNPAEE
ncbi:hypothetical protein NGM10_07955 [Halorussus salilacus]|uniref:hypothetical protein n=1 Tax=Halorussus salilacus TaxID=2953750 RepID=UPI00209CC3B9|nr:hypothetical protein [Halorussus salilacus]USZ66679.1 hypothetical protein NGM10_07955 [Halorussus salilacus]